jgi:hypothetical protein
MQLHSICSSGPLSSFSLILLYLHLNLAPLYCSIIASQFNAVSFALRFSFGCSRLMCLFRILAFVMLLSSTKQVALFVRPFLLLMPITFVYILHIHSLY